MKNQYQKLRILLALVKKVLGEDFDEEEYVDVEEVITRVSKRVINDTETNKILLTCIGNSI